MPKTIPEMLECLKQNGISLDDIAIYPKTHCKTEEYVALKPEGDKWEVKVYFRNVIVDKGIYSEEEACYETLCYYCIY